MSFSTLMVAVLGMAAGVALLFDDLDKAIGAGLVLDVWLIACNDWFGGKK